MSNLERHAKSELKIAGLFDKDSDYDGELGKATMELIKLFSKQGHSGCSAGMVRELFNKLSDFKPIEPLSGEDSEWTEVSKNKYQNKRCSHVFKDSKEDKAYDINGIIFEDSHGRYTNCYSRIFITFPYIPSFRIKKIKNYFGLRKILVNLAIIKY